MSARRAHMKNTLKDKEYYNFTEYSIASFIKKLDFIIQIVEKFAKNKSEVKILDVGCGGDIALPLASLGYNVMGIDFSPEAINYCKSKNRFKNALFKVADAENFNPSDQFDVIICSEILEHLKKPSQLLNSIRKILKQDGIIIITIPNGYGPWEIFYDTPIRIARKIGILNPLKKMLYKLGYSESKSTSNWGSPHIQNFTINGLRLLLRKNDLQILQIRNSFFISIIPFLRKTKFDYYDCKIADKLPHFLVSGWYFVCKSLNKNEKSV